MTRSLLDNYWGWICDCASLVLPKATKEPDFSEPTSECQSIHCTRLSDLYRRNTSAGLGGDNPVGVDSPLFPCCRVRRAPAAGKALSDSHRRWASRRRWDDRGDAATGRGPSGPLRPDLAHPLRPAAGG